LDYRPNNYHLDRRAPALLAAGEGDGDDLMTTAAVAHWFGCSVEWLEIGRSKNRNYGPPFVRIGGRVRYKRDAVRRWLAERTVHAEMRRSHGDPPPMIRKAPMPNGA
jgi:hypothetical protein